MSIDSSIAQELEKIRTKWGSIEKRKWDMVIWVCGYEDVTILDKFMDIEASPIGVFDAIFFRFQSIYTTDAVFEEHLWNEFLSWFNTSEDKTYDLIHAYKKDGYLPENYEVNRSLPPSFKSVITELNRLKSLLPFKEENFILYFSPALHSADFEQWFVKQLSNNVLPVDFRLATIDIAVKRNFSKLLRHKKANVIELTPNLDMANAMRNEMNKDSDGARPHAPSSQFQKQVRKVMDATINDKLNLDKEAKTLIQLGNQLQKLTTKATSYLICATAYFSKKEDLKAHENADKAIEMVEPEIPESDEAYPIWRSALMTKASLYAANKKNRPQAITCYEKLVKESAKQGDVFYTMEGYRMLAFINYQSKQLQQAWEHSIFSLQAGTNLPLDIRRASTFLFSAALAKQLCKEMYKPKKVEAMLVKQFEKQIGNDWQELMKSTEILNAKYIKRKKPLNV